MQISDYCAFFGISQYLYSDDAALSGTLENNQIKGNYLETPTDSLEIEKFMSKQPFALEDAREMLSILRSAKCFARYDHISHELVGELIVAIATGGEVIGGNNLGSDIRAPKYGLIEVKSRILGTDGPFPRVSLKQRNLDKAAWFAAVRWDRKFSLHDVVMLPKSAVSELYSAKQQASGLAHISWKDWTSNKSALSLKDDCLTALGLL